jgi:hypothetical protein
MAGWAVFWLTQAMVASLPAHSGTLGFGFEFYCGVFGQPAGELVHDFLVSGIVR